MAIARAFSNPADRNKIQACPQKPNELCMIIMANSKLSLKNSGLPLNVESTWVAFNSMLINELNQDLSLLVKRIRTEWETTPSPDLVNLANQLTHILDDSTKVRPRKS